MAEPASFYSPWLDSCQRRPRGRNPPEWESVKADGFGLTTLLTPRPFLAELMDDVTRVTDIHLMLSPDLVAICAGILMTVGLISGFLPAWRASRLDPIESLRYE